MKLILGHTLDGLIVATGEKIAYRIGKEGWRTGTYYWNGIARSRPTFNTGGLLNQEITDHFEFQWPCSVGESELTCENCGQKIR